MGFKLSNTKSKIIQNKKGFKEKMKQRLIKFSAASLLAAVFIITGCSKNDNFLGPNGLNQVSFSISQQTGQFGGIQFLFRSSADTKLSRIISKLDAQQFADTLSYGNPNYVYSKDTTYIINEYTGIQPGQQWKFDFTGSMPNQNNSNYTVSTNYTVQ
jgi:hypothetical protein